MDPLTPGQRAFFNMITNPGLVYRVPHNGPPGLEMIKAYRFSSTGELEHYYTGRAGWHRCSYSDDWGSFIAHWGEKLVIMSNDESKKLV